MENQGPIHVSSITCSSSGGASQTTFGTMREYNVSCTAVPLQPCHSQLILYARNIPNAVCAASPEYEQVRLETCRGPWFSINLMKSASCWFVYTDILWCTASKTLSKANLSTLEERAAYLSSVTTKHSRKTAKHKLASDFTTIITQKSFEDFRLFVSTKP
jgi:hypothetical protein